MAKPKTGQKIFIGLLAFMTTFALAGFTGFFGTGTNVSQHGGTPQAADTSGIPCLTSGAFHVHPRLTILIDGQEQSGPANVGVTPGCTREIHTHEPDGVIHVEGPLDRGYTFADFLAVWGIAFNQPGFITRLTVNGEFNDNNPNFILEDGQEIRLEYITLPLEGLGISTGTQDSTDVQEAGQNLNAPL